MLPQHAALPMEGLPASHSLCRLITIARPSFVCGFPPRLHFAHSWVKCPIWLLCRSRLGMKNMPAHAGGPSGLTHEVLGLGPLLPSLTNGEGSLGSWEGLSEGPGRPCPPPARSLRTLLPERLPQTQPAPHSRLSRLLRSTLLSKDSSMCLFFGTSGIELVSLKASEFTIKHLPLSEWCVSSCPFS